MLVVTAERLKYSGHPSFLTKMCPPPPEPRGHDCTFVFFLEKTIEYWDIWGRKVWKIREVHRGLCALCTWALMCMDILIARSKLPSCHFKMRQRGPTHVQYKKKNIINLYAKGSWGEDAILPFPCCNQSLSCIQLTLLTFSSTEERMETRDSEGESRWWCLYSLHTNH